MPVSAFIVTRPSPHVLLPLSEFVTFLLIDTSLQDPFLLETALLD